MRLYLAGPMTGRPDHNFAAFHLAAQRLRALGHEVVSPAELDETGELPSWEAYMRRDLAVLVTCEAVAVLPGWAESRGATLEVHVARQLSMPVLDAETLEPVREDVLAEAARLVHGARQRAYGHPADDFARTGAMWGAILHAWAREAARSETPVPVPAALAILCMIAVKISRETNAAGRDNAVDIAGYAGCLAMVRERAGDY